MSDEKASTDVTEAATSIPSKSLREVSVEEALKASKAVIVDTAVRYARKHSWCTETNEFLNEAFPEGPDEGASTWYDSDGCDCQGNAWRDSDGFDRAGRDRNDRDRDGFDAEGRDRDGFNREGLDQAGIHKDDVARYRFNTYLFDRDGYSPAGLDLNGYDRFGFDANGFTKPVNALNVEGFDRHGFDETGFNAEGRDRNGFNREGIDNHGFNRAGINADGVDRYGRPEAFVYRFDHRGRDPLGYDTSGYHVATGRSHSSEPEHQEKVMVFLTGTVDGKPAVASEGPATGSEASQ